jgi:cytochrome c-type biogenesis protein CcmF
MVIALLHIVFGKGFGFPAFVYEEAHYEGVVGQLLKHLGAAAPLITTTLVAFNFAVIFQEFQRGVRARRKNSNEGVLAALLNLVSKSRRRYGGYIVHAGIGFMFLGFAGKAWEIEKEASLAPGQSVEIGSYSLKYTGPRMEVDPEKRMIFTDLEVSRGGQFVSTASPAKFVYKKQQMPTTEVSILSSLRDDLYLAVGTVDPATKVATFRVHVNPLVSWIWIGVLVLISGAFVSLWPDVSFKQLGVWSYVRASAGATSGVMLAVLIATSPARALNLHSTTGLNQSDALASAPPPVPNSPLPGWPAWAAILSGVAIAGIGSRWVLQRPQK